MNHIIILGGIVNRWKHFGSFPKCKKQCSFPQLWAVIHAVRSFSQFNPKKPSSSETFPTDPGCFSGHRSSNSNACTQTWPPQGMPEAFTWLHTTEKRSVPTDDALSSARAVLYARTQRSSLRSRVQCPTGPRLNFAQDFRAVSERIHFILFKHRNLNRKLAKCNLLVFTQSL